MGLGEWFRNNGEIAKINVEFARWRMSDASRRRFRSGYEDGYASGHSDGIKGHSKRHKAKFPPPHPQVDVYGIEVDDGLSDLLVALWKLGLDTQYSCQGQPNRYSPNHPGSWDASAQILFTDADQALKFVKKAIELLGDDGYHEGGFRVNVCHGIDSATLRGDVRFCPELIPQLTEVWTAFETELRLHG